MINTTAAKNNIKKREIPQIDSILDTGAQQGMISLVKYAERLVQKGLVDPKDVEWIINARKTS